MFIVYEDEAYVSTYFYAVAKSMRIVHKKRIQFLLLDEISLAILRTIANMGLGSRKEVIKNVTKVGIFDKIYVKYKSENFVVQTIKNMFHRNGLYSFLLFYMFACLSLIVIGFNIHMLTFPCILISAFFMSVSMVYLMVCINKELGDKRRVFLLFASSLLVSLALMWLWGGLLINYRQKLRLFLVIMEVALFVFLFLSSNLIRRVALVDYISLFAIVFFTLEASVLTLCINMAYVKYIGDLLFIAMMYALVIQLASGVYIVRVSIRGKRKIVCRFLYELRKNLRQENISIPNSLKEEIRKIFSMDILKTNLDDAITKICKKEILVLNECFDF